MKSILLTSLFFCLSFISFGQRNKGGVMDSDQPITWLGLDYTQAKFIGTATQFGDAGEVTTEQIRDKYIPAWNDYFLNEQKKYDVAKYTKRSSVKYAMDVVKRPNNSLHGNFFSEDPNQYEHLDEAKIASLVKGYNFMGNTGVGMMFFIEGMSKGKSEMSAWVALIDMDSKKVLQTKRMYGKAGGFGFKQFWAKGFFNILKDVYSEMK